MSTSTWPIAGSKGASRRATATVLAGLSVLVSRPSLNLLAELDELLDIVTTGFLLYQLVGSEPLVGLYVAWVFIGYVVCPYTPELCLGQFGEIVNAWGFRVITALVTVYVGVVFSRNMDMVPTAGAFALMPGG